MTWIYVFIVFLVQFCRWAHPRVSQRGLLPLWPHRQLVRISHASRWPWLMNSIANSIGLCLIIRYRERERDTNLIRYRERERDIFFANKQLPVDMKIIWNKKLRTTAGYCCYLGALGDRNARIELSTKVVDSYGRYDQTNENSADDIEFFPITDRIRDTLVHEMCHAATWIIDGIKGGGHGREWRDW